MTGNALNHRFRHLKAEALIIDEGRKQGFDMKNLAFEGNLPATQSAVDINGMHHSRPRAPNAASRGLFNHFISVLAS